MKSHYFSMLRAIYFFSQVYVYSEKKKNSRRFKLFSKPEHVQLLAREIYVRVEQAMEKCIH